MQIELRLLGKPRIWIDGQESTLSFNKQLWLLIYLAYENSWLSRDRLANLFRPDSEESLAKRTLRFLLYRAKKLEWTRGLEISLNMVRF